MQSGWLRTSVRKLDTQQSTLLEPVLSLRKKDAARLPKGKFAKVTVPLYYQGHVYRAGSRMRVTLSAPRRRPAGLGVRGAAAAVGHERRGRARPDAAVAARAAGRARDHRADAAAALPGAARRALPDVRALGVHSRTCARCS